MTGRDGVTNISMVGENPSVAVSCNPSGHRMPVTPLFSQPHVPQARLSNQVSSPAEQPKLKKVLVKAVSKRGSKADSKVFSLRNVNLSSISELKRAIRDEFSDEITSKEFDVGYLCGSTVVRIRSKDDITELRGLLAKSQITLWCDGLRSGKKRALSDSDDESDHDFPRSKKSRKKSTDTTERDKEVQGYVEELKEKHGSKFSPMQFRIWGEMKAGGLHPSLDNPPATSMFNRAGSGVGTSTKMKRNEQSPVVKAVTDAATAITSAVLAKPQDLNGRQRLLSDINGSPAKRIENRAKLYRQLSDLKSLKDAGVLSDEEYCEEKEAIMDFLKELNARK